ncbi:MAG: archaellin/type IV pilin N-terminal domain-containing protein [Archaeoglobaceae archaeon]
MGVKIGLRRDEKGFTGLEAAIVLIAFVVVAAVFSYVMLGAGFYTTQKSKQVVDTGVKQASSSLTLDGQYIYLDASENAGGKTGSEGKVGAIFFYVTQTAGGSPVDLEKTSIAITTASGYKQVFFEPLIKKDDKVIVNSTAALPSGFKVQGGSSNVSTVEQIIGVLKIGNTVNVSYATNQWCNGTVENFVSGYAYNGTNYTPAVGVVIKKDGNNYCTIVVGKSWWYESVVGDKDNVVEMNEKYKLVLAVNVNNTAWRDVWNTTANSPWDGIGDIKPNDVITIEVRPPIGAPLSITKQLPPSFTDLTYV